MNKKAKTCPVLIFDFDGTIADTHQYIIGISNRLAREFGYKHIAPEDVENLKNKTAREVIGILKIPLLKVPGIISRAKKEFYEDIDSLRPFAGLADVLAEMKGRDIAMGILSSNDERNVRAFLRNHDLEGLFDFIHTTVKVWSKNTALKDLMKKYGIPPDGAIYVGDETRDITAARRLKTRVAAVTWGYNSAEVLAEHQPDFLLHHPEELYKIITPCPQK